MKTIQDSFWRFVEKTDTCWLWSGFRHSKTGYGYASVNGVRGLAHRKAYELANGPIPKGMWVLHKCDVRNCVNPAHLYLGDRARNMKDAHERGRIDMRAVASHIPPFTDERKARHSEAMKRYYAQKRAG